MVAMWETELSHDIFFEILTGTFQENWGQTILRFWPQNILIYSEKILNLKDLRQYDKRFLSSDLFCFLFFLFHSWLIEVQEPLFHTFHVFLGILFPRILFSERALEWLRRWKVMSKDFLKWSNFLSHCVAVADC